MIGDGSPHSETPPAALRDMTTKPSEQLFEVGGGDKWSARERVSDKRQPIPRRVESEEE